MLDLTPLEQAWEREKDPEEKKFLKIGLDLLLGGFIASFESLFESGEYPCFFKPRNAYAVTQIFEQLLRKKRQNARVLQEVKAEEAEKKTVVKKEEDEKVRVFKKEGYEEVRVVIPDLVKREVVEGVKIEEKEEKGDPWCLVCALPSPNDPTFVDLFRASVARGKRPLSRRYPPPRPWTSRSTRLRHKYGKGVKIKEETESESDGDEVEVVEVRSVLNQAQEIIDISDGDDEVGKTHESLYSCMQDLPPSAFDVDYGL